MSSPDRKILYEYTDRSGCCLFSLFSLGASAGMGCVSIYLFIQALLSFGWLIFILLILLIGLPMLLYSLLIGWPIDFMQFMLFVPIIRLRARENRINLSLGIFSWPGRTILKEDILHIGATPENLEKYAGKFGFHPPKGWTRVFVATSARGLMIVTSKAKYLVACPDPDEAEARLTEIFGPWKSEIELPEIRRKQDSKSGRKK